MYITYKSRSTKLSSFLLTFLFWTILTLPAAAIDLPFDPNDYNFLVYNPEGTEASILGAMKIILGRDLDSNEIRDPYNEVTSNDLATHDILIVGWNDSDGDVSELDDETLAAGITGRVILTGHDADYHTVNDNQFAELFLVQAIDWVLKGDGTGLITLGCTDAFPYLPEFWDVIADANGGGQNVNEFTSEGLASGVYDDLVPDNMSGWTSSYHDIFTIEQDSFFVPFELGGDSDNDIITIASYKISFFCSV